jgi:hypothetical protein
MGGEEPRARAQSPTAVWAVASGRRSVWASREPVDRGVQVDIAGAGTGHFGPIDGPLLGGITP